MATAIELENIVARIEVAVKELTENQKQQSAELAEHRKEIDGRLTRALEKMSEEISRSASNLGRSLGALMEFIVVPGIRPLMREQGHEFCEAASNKRIKAREKEIAEVDMLLVGNTAAMAVEVKTRLTEGDVADHEKRLKKLYVRASEISNVQIQNKDLYGAVVGLFIDKSAQKLAQEKGFYVIKIIEEKEKLEIIPPVNKVKPYCVVNV